MEQMRGKWASSCVDFGYEIDTCDWSSDVCSCDLDERRAGIQATSGKSDLISSQGILVSTPLETENSGTLSHTYC